MGGGGQRGTFDFPLRLLNTPQPPLFFASPSPPLSPTLTHQIPNIQIIHFSCALYRTQLTPSSRVTDDVKGGGWRERER